LILEKSRLDDFFPNSSGHPVGFWKLKPGGIPRSLDPFKPIWTDMYRVVYVTMYLSSNRLCFDKIISLYFGAPKTTTIDIGAQRKRDFLDLLKNLPKNY
jgi:hypothetical protein